MEKITRKLAPALLILFLLVIFTPDVHGQSAFTQEDHDLLIELKTKVAALEKQITDLREDMNKRFDQFMNFVGILAAVFAAITVATISFAIWDRRTMIRPFETKVSQLDKRITDNRETNKQLIAALKEYAAKDKKFANIIQHFNLF